MSDIRGFFKGASSAKPVEQSSGSGGPVSNAHNSSKSTGASESKKRKVEQDQIEDAKLTPSKMNVGGSSSNSAKAKRSRADISESNIETIEDSDSSTGDAAYDSYSSNTRGTPLKSKVVPSSDPSSTRMSPRVASSEKAAPVTNQTASSAKTRAAPVTNQTASSAKTTSQSSSLTTSSKAMKPERSLPLADLKIVVTGVMESTSREEIEQLILENGAKVVGSVSGKTNYLVAGNVLEDGRPSCESNKYKTAVSKGVPILTEQELLAMIPKKPTASATGSKTSETTMPMPKIKPSRAGAGCDVDMSLWVDKYKPKNSSQLIGSAELVRKLGDWLRRWEDVHIARSVKVPFSKENPGAKAVLLSGPPGIGKSTVAGLAAVELNYDVIELNASDARSKKSVEGVLSNATTSISISSCFAPTATSGSSSSSSSSSSGGKGSRKKRLIIMDEVDGMGGSDRGGIAELIKVIKNSKVPIVCICNDRQSQKIRSLVNHCFDIRVKRPTKSQIAQRLVTIAATEGLQMESNAAEMLVEQSGNDIRQALNAMQMWHTQSKSMQYADMRDSVRRIEKDKVLRLTPFDACGQILSGSRSPFQDRYESFFIDYSLTPLLVQQNYVDAAKNGIFRMPDLDEAARMERLSRAADAVSDSELVGAAIMGQNPHWELLPSQAAFCLHAGYHVQGFQGFPTFPAWLGKYSTTSKMRRLTNELVHHTALSIGQGFMPIRLDYAYYLRQAMLKILQGQSPQDGGQPASELVEMLDWYGFSREDFMENMKEMQFTIEAASSGKPPILTDQFSALDSKAKAAFTRAYNSKSHKSQVLVSELASKTSGKGRKSASSGTEEPVIGPDGVIDEDQAIEEEEDEDSGDGKQKEDDISALIAKPKGKAKTTAAKVTSSASAAASSKSKVAKAAAPKSKKK